MTDAPADPGRVEPASSPPGPVGTMQFDWRDEAPTRELVEALQRGESVETRAFVKPIFKWMKTGVRKSGQRNELAIEKAFAFVAWMEQLKRGGDDQWKIAPQPQLDATYALNTIVTSAQRASSRAEGERAFAMLKQFGYTPDVFTYTALIDVVARSRDVRSAFQKYEEIRAQSATSRPNLVVFLTVIRAIGFTDEIPVETCLDLLDDAHRDGVFDDSLYVRTIELCAKRRSGDVATRILGRMCEANVDWKGQQPILRALQRVLQRIDNANDVLEGWFTHGYVTEEDVEAIKLATSMILALYSRGSSALGCARHVSETARHAVMHHAIDRLIERFTQGAKISSSEFETLVHQCRKRKRKDDVVVILDAMREISTNGWRITVSANDASTSGSETVVEVDPQPQIAPNSATYAAVVETFLACADEESAWQAFLDATTKDFARDQLLYRKFIRGCCLLMEPTHMIELLGYASVDGIQFTARMQLDIARMHGHHHSQGIDIVLHRIPMLSPEQKHALLQELVTSCASCQNVVGVEATIDAIIAEGFARTAETDLAVLECCVHCADVGVAINLLRSFQAKQLLADVPVYASLLREIFFKCTRKDPRNGGRQNDADSRRPALKMLHLRQAFIKAIADLEPQAEPTDAVATDTKMNMVHRHNDAAIQYWTRHPSSYAPMMFLQHIVEATATVVDKQQRAATTQLISKAIQSTSDPLEFVIRAAMALPMLDLPFRAQSKLAKQLFALVASRPYEVQDHHIAISLANFNTLNVYLVKELDDALSIVARPDGLDRVLAFCLDSLNDQVNNTEKVVAFLLSRPALCTHESAALLTPTLARLFAVECDALVLQYFKPNGDSDSVATETRRQFLRQVIKLERQGGDATLARSRRAITDLKLEHEAEFLPILVSHSLSFTNGAITDKTRTRMDREYLTLPFPPSRVILVDDADTLQFAYEVLVYEDTVRRIALDAEWRPTPRVSNSSFTPCALLQIACDSHVFLLDLLALDMDDLDELLGFLLENESIAKLGFRLDGDLQRLRLTFPDATCFDADEMQNVVDLATDGSGLSALVEDVLGLPLDKTQQCSDWEKRPLSKDQIAYAALDAYCLLMVHEATSTASAY